MLSFLLTLGLVAGAHAPDVSVPERAILERTGLEGTGIEGTGLERTAPEQAAPDAAAPDRAAPDRAAIDAYRRGDLESARSLWLAALEGEGGARPAPLERARILYDLGNAAYRAGLPLDAVGWYTASLRLRPRDADTWQNLEHARTAAHLEPADRGDLAATLWRLLTALTAAESRWLALGGAAVCAAFLAFEALRGGRVSKRLALLGVLVALGSLAPLAYHRASEGGDPLLVIEAADGGAQARSEPRADAAVIGSIGAGEQVERQDELPGWVKVDGGSLGSGWVESRSVFALAR